MTYAPASRHRAGLMMPRHAHLVESTMIWCGTSTGSANAQIIAPEFTADMKGHPTYVWIAGYSNTAAMTLSADGGATNTSHRKADGTAFTGAEIVAGNIYQSVFDGTYWRLIGGGGGAVSYPAIAKSGTYTVALADAGKLIVATGSWTLNLPAASGLSGFTIALRSTTGTITIDPSGSEQINAAATASIPAGIGTLIICDGTAWYTVGDAGYAATSATTLDPANAGSGMSLSNSNRTAINSTGSWASVRTTQAITAGKWYCAARQDVTDASPARSLFGLVSSTYSMSSLISGANAWALSDAGTLNVNGTNTSSWSGTWTSAGSVCGMAVDATTLSSVKVWFAINGVWLNSGDPVTGANPAATITGSPTLYAAISLISSQQMTMQFDRPTFSYAAPSGYAQLP